MRQLHGHKVNPANDVLTIDVLDDPGSGGACHSYMIGGFKSDPASPGEHNAVWINFQNGPIAEAGVNGITHEALLAILIDRMQGFQAGPYACSQNEDVLLLLVEAQAKLHERTLARMGRGVEGTHQV